MCVVTADGPTTRSDSTSAWWANAVYYQVYPRSYADSDGDGVGDLAGLRDKLGYLELLGVNAIWLNPIMRSPMADHGYDVSDPRDIDPLFGDLDEFDALVRDAHDAGLRVVMDLVPNHTSREHPWFLEALAAPPGSDARRRYHFRDGRGRNGDEPPNNWPSVFGGPAWTRTEAADGTPGQWYLHLFAPEQPDLDWDDEDVADDLETTLRFWLDRGVDGFRIDVAHGMAKPAGLPDAVRAPGDGSLLEDFDDDPRFNDPGVHAVHRRIRAVLDEYPDAVAIGEIWAHDPVRFSEYLRPDELHLAFNFRLALADWDAAAVHAAIDGSFDAVAPVGAAPTWTLSNHDVPREVTRYGGGARGLARARAMLLVALALPGAVFVYNGEELGLPDAPIPDDLRQDPTWERSGHTKPGRDGARVPLPWEGDAPPFGFTEGTAWLPQPDDWAALTVEAQLEDPGSTLSFVRHALELRASWPTSDEYRIDWYGAPPGCLAFLRPGGIVCALNTTDEPVPLPPGEVILRSTGDPGGDHTMGPDTAVWMLKSPR